MLINVNINHIYIYHMLKLVWVIPKWILQASVGTKKEGSLCCQVLQSLLLGTLIGGHPSDTD